MNILELRAEVEQELTWRRRELRHLRNRLLGPAPTGDELASAMRTLMVMQYAHLEGLTKQTLSVYARAINSERALAEALAPEVAAAGLAPEFESLRAGSSPASTDPDERRLRQAERETHFVLRLRSLDTEPIELDIDRVVSLESNLSSDVLKRILYRVGISPTDLDRTLYRSLEFVRRTRHDVAHGVHTVAPARSEFEAHMLATDRLMDDLVRLVYSACRFGHFRRVTV
ncbi:MAG: MAE_28990/MAE_18760 family HEPN-like nuclease [Actinomycetota bacterium]